MRRRGTAARPRIRACVLGCLTAAGLFAHPDGAAAQEPVERPSPDTLDPPGLVADSLRPAGGYRTDAIDVIEAPLRLATHPLKLVFGAVFAGIELAATERTFVHDGVHALVSAGIEPRPGSVGPNSGIGLLVDVRTFQPFYLEAGVSIDRSQRYGAGLRLGSVHGVAAGYRFQRSAARDFWGIGGTTSPEGRSEFLHDRQTAGGEAWAVRGRWRIEGGLAREDHRIDRGLGSGEPDLQDVYDPLPPGARGRHRWLRADLGSTLDLTHRAGLQLRGAWLRASTSWYRGVGGAETDFHRLEGELRTYLPVDRRHALAIRAFARATRRDDGPAIPFFELASVGSTDGLRGFPAQRFTDHDAFGLMTEWRYEVWRELHDRSRVEGFVFLDAAGVGRRLDEIDASAVRFGYGLGLRMVTVDRLIGYAYLGFSEEATRFRIGNSLTF